MVFLTLLFFRLADGLSTSRVDPSISISIHTGVKSFLMFVRDLTLHPYNIFIISHPFPRPDVPCDSSTMMVGMVGGSVLLVAGRSLPSWQWLHLYETTSPRHGTLMVEIFRQCLYTMQWSDVLLDVTAMSLSTVPPGLWFWTLLPPSHQSCSVSSIRSP